MADEKRQLILDLLARNKTKQGTDEAARELDKLGHAAEDADKKTESLGKTSEETSRQTDKLGHNLGDTKKRVSDLDKEIGIVNRELAALSASFADTQNASERLDITKAIRRTEGELRRLTKNRNVLKDLLPDPAPEGKSWVGRLGNVVTDGLSSVGKKIADNKFLVAGVASAVVTLSPLVGGLISAAVVGGVGLGGIIGGIALAAKASPEIQGYATRIGKTFADRLSMEARGAFLGPVMENLGKLEAAADKAGSAVGTVFQELAPSISPLVDNLIRGSELLGKSLVNAAGRAGPVVGALGGLFENVSNHLGDFINLMASHSDEATSAVNFLSGAIGALIDVAGDLVGLFLNVVKVIDTVTGAIGHATGVVSGFLGATEQGTRGFRMYREGADGATGAVDAYGNSLTGAVSSTDNLKDAHTGAATAADQQKKAEQELAAQLKAETDPAFGLLNAIDSVSAAKKDLTEATRKYGGQSTQAQAATRHLAEAAIALQGAASGAGGALDGTMSPALRATLTAAHLTKAQIAAVEKELRDAKAAAEAYAGNYRANFTAVYTTNYVTNYGKAGQSRDKRAAGGPIVRGKPYLVGENGPEMIIPDASGRVLTAAASRGVMTAAAQRGTSNSASGGGGPAKMTFEVTGGADQAVATLINYLIRLDKIQVRVA